MFGIKGRDTFNRPLSNRAQIVRVLKEKWLKYFPYILGFLMICSVSFSGYVWYVYVHTKELSASEETAYITEKKQEVTFRQNKFDDIKDEIIMREERYDAERADHNDIFYHTESVEDDAENENITE